MDSLVDIESLALRCREDRAREYVQEAIQCYRAGAYRSAIVNTWIAVVFDLVHKVRELALSGDARARAVNERYEAYLAQIEAKNDQGTKSALEFERTIVNTCAEKFQFFNHQQLRDLDRLREDRHQCAHPSFQRAGEPYRPTAEQARVHLRTAVDHVLSQPPVQGRAAIASITAVVASEYFPRERVQAVVALRTTPLSNPSEALVRALIDDMMFGFVDPAHALQGKLQVGSALLALLDTHRAVAEPRIASQLSKIVGKATDAELPLIALLLAGAPDALQLIDEPAVVRLREFIRSGPGADVMKVLTTFSKSPRLSEAAEGRVRMLSRDELADAISLHGLGGEAKERALVLLSEVRNWNAANAVLAKLIMPLFEFLSRADAERIIRMPTESGTDLPGAIGYARFLEEVRRTGLVPDQELDQLMIEHGARNLLAG